jgi:hypothetical protein
VSLQDAETWALSVHVVGWQTGDATQSASTVHCPQAPQSAEHESHASHPLHTPSPHTGFIAVTHRPLWHAQEP